VIVVPDAGPLIYLGGAGELDLLRKLYDEVVVPRVVYDEVVLAGAGLSGAQEVAAASWLRVEDMAPDPTLAATLDRGEAAAIQAQAWTGLKSGGERPSWMDYRAAARPPAARGAVAASASPR
jgi:predicted nucleic acid-binding protein